VLSVLLIDDEPAILEMLIQIAERSREMSILPAQSAKEALKILSEQSFDVIITDYAMPDMDGIAFIKKIRSDNNTTPVILFCDATGDNVAADALNSGASYYFRKGRDLRRQFHEIAKIAQELKRQSISSHAIRITSRVIADLINFSSDPSFAIDRSGMVIAWNDSMEQLTDMPASALLGKGEYIYAEPFHGLRKKMLVDLVFERDDEIKRENYMIISRVKNGPIIGVTRGVRKDGSCWTLWTKAMPVYDAQGNFLAVVGTVRDVTATFGDIIARDAVKERAIPPLVHMQQKSKTPVKKLLGSLMNTATSHYKEGVIQFIRNRDFPAAITAFDRAIEIDDSLAYVWNDRGICYRELGDYTNALKSCLRAVELAPESPQCLFTLGETLEQIGIMYMSTKYLDSAVQTFKMVANQLPNNADTWSHIGVCNKEMGKADESKFYLDRARDIRLGDKDSPISYTRDDYL
jgi:PAS domain S-box-containing protein